MKKSILLLVSFGWIVVNGFLHAQTPQATAQEIIQLLQTGESKEYIGEPVSQLFHALQAAQMARNAYCEDETIIAALLHDIGHICGAQGTQQMGIYGALSHEYIGGNYLKSKGFSPKIIAIVQGHVNAKRYLCYKNSAYYQALSSASQQTLAFQGGPMTEFEARAFEENPYFEEILLVRSFDEKAKDPEAVVQELYAYMPMIVDHLSKKS